MQMVETISLLYNSRDNGFVGVNMYVDDAGSVRGAERNVRASELAHCCGQPLDVKGDAFLARVMDNGDDFARMDFNLAEMSSSAAWVKAAAQQAAQRRQRDSAESVLRRMQDGGGKKEATATVRELSPAEAAKEEGNAAFKRGDWANAVGHYTQAVEFDPHMLPALNNRAMALLKLERWQEALEDCQTVLGMQPSNVKALLRAAAAEMELGMLPEAKRHLEDAVSAEPNNKEAAQRLAQLSQTL